MRKNGLILLFLFGWIATTYGQQVPLQIYGGKSHDVYLGCFNCGKFEATSIWNAFGSHGSKFNPASIWNKFGSYGGQFNIYSPFNPYSSTPPVIVDKDGNFYGYLTININMEKRANSKLAVLIYKNWEEIADDVTGWYTKIFE